MRGVYTIFKHWETVASPRLSFLSPLPPPAMAGAFFICAVSTVGQEVILNFLKIYGGGVVVLSITKVLGTGGE
jgi:hypothetical protein